MPNVQKNQKYTVTIEGYTHEGLGVTHVDGLAVFIPQTIRGEVCQILIVKVQKTFAFGKLLKVVEPSAERRELQCPYASQCGGCVYWHMSYEEELVAKKQKVQDAMTRIGGCSVEVESILGADQVTHYRNKAQYPVSPEAKVGFFKARTHEVVPVLDCPIEKEEANQVATTIQQWMEEYKITGYEETTQKGLLRHIYVRTNEQGESLVCLVLNGKRLPHSMELQEKLQKSCPYVSGILVNINQKTSNVILGDQYETIWGKDTLKASLFDFSYEISVPSFFQVNHNQTEKLYQVAREFASLSSQEIALDLYCGIGTITSVLAQDAKYVIGAEIVPEAIENAKKSAIENGLTNKTEFLCADASQAAKEIRQRQIALDVICVDPPRKGLTPDVIEEMMAMGPKKIVYVSCDPGTLARDIKLLQKQYQVKRVIAVDMFPRTHHVESVVLLTKVHN